MSGNMPYFGGGDTDYVRNRDPKRQEGLELMTYNDLVKSQSQYTKPKMLPLLSPCPCRFSAAAVVQCRGT